MLIVGFSFSLFLQGAMSAAGCQESPTKAKNIQFRRVLLSDSSQLPSDLSSTPGGTMYSTTPGGTRIIYDRAFLMQCRNSPLSKSPVPNLPKIPGVTCPAVSNSPKRSNAKEMVTDKKPIPVVTDNKPSPTKTAESDPQFEMDI